MPLELNVPAEPTVLRYAKVGAYKVEIMNGNYVILWMCLGTMEGDVFTEYAGPGYMPTEIKIEDGNHPLSPGMALRKCSVCGAWCTLETECPVDGCGAETVPYDGFTRLASSPPDGSSMYGVNKNALYNFLTTEVVPDLVTWQEAPLADAKVVG